MECGIFVIGLFIVVKGLEVSGFAEYAGGVLFSNLSDNIIVATFVISLISALMCNLVNNIPMTAMMLSILQHPGLTPDMNTAMAYSLVIAVESWRKFYHLRVHLLASCGLRAQTDTDGATNPYRFPEDRIVS